MNFRISPSHSLIGTLNIPGDKSISHRAVMLASLADGTSHISGFLNSADCLATLHAFTQMGVSYNETGDQLSIQGVGLHGLKAPKQCLDVGNSGTSMRLLAGILAGQIFDSELTGDESLQKRPMARVIKPLRTMGAKITALDDNFAPLRIYGGQILKGIDYNMPIASAQVKSCLLLAGLYAQNEITIHEPHKSRDHTERMLKSFGVKITTDGDCINMKSGQSLNATDVNIPSDISSAAFFIVAGLIAKDSEILLKHIGINPTRIGILEILREMGANITLENQRTLAEEPIADIRVRSSKLRGIIIDPKNIPSAIDEFPAIFIAAANAEGKTVLRGAQELRVKESDRLHAMALGLTNIGVAVEEYSDGISITGGTYEGGVIDSLGDHRIAMSFSIAGLRAQSPILIKNCVNVATSFPNFVTIARHAGLNIEIV
jgi:3-phosphoshikimate 1-carboxyvinyltransferase